MVLDELRLRVTVVKSLKNTVVVSAIPGVNVKNKPSMIRKPPTAKTAIKPS